MHKRHLKHPHKKLYTFCGHRCTEMEFKKLPTNLSLITCSKCKTMHSNAKKKGKAI